LLLGLQELHGRLLLLRAGHLHIHGLFARLGNIIHDSLQEATFRQWSQSGFIG
jgi:hypothetical protein